MQGREGEERGAVVPESERRSAAALRPWMGQEGTRGRGRLFGRCMRERGSAETRVSTGEALYRRVPVHHGRGPRHARVSLRREKEVKGGGA